MKPRINAPVFDVAPADDGLTDYDRLHLVTYVRLLDADAEGAAFEEVARVLLHIDPEIEPERARLAYETHLARARWIARVGYRHLLTDEKLGQDEPG